MKKVSFIVPCYRSENTIQLVVDEIECKMSDLAQYIYEVILIDDCSPDNTFQTIKMLCKSKNYIKGICLSKNFGQHAALMVGMHYSDGDYIVCIDDDGQTPTEEVEKLINKLEQGYDAVYASYKHKQHAILRKFVSWVNGRMACIILGKPKDLFISGYFGIQKFLADEIIRYKNSYPNINGLVLRATKNIINVEVNPRKQKEDIPGSSIKKIFAIWSNGFISFSINPLRISTGIGGICAVGGFVYGLYTIINRVLNPNIPVGFSSGMSAIVFFGGMIMLTLGLLGEYIGRIYISLNNSPQYVIKERVNCYSKTNQ